MTWDWSHFEDILEENMVNLQNEGWGPLGDLTGAPKGPKMANIDQNLEFIGFCHHRFHSGKNFLLFSHWSNAEIVVENDRREWRPLGAQQAGLKGPKMAKIDQNLEFFLFCFHPIHSGNKFSLSLHLSYARGVVQNDRLIWGTQGGPLGGPKVPKMASEYSTVCGKAT